MAKMYIERDEFPGFLGHGIVCSSVYAGMPGICNTCAVCWKGVACPNVSGILVSDMNYVLQPN